MARGSKGTPFENLTLKLAGQVQVSLSLFFFFYLFLIHTATYPTSLPFFFYCGKIYITQNLPS